MELNFDEWLQIRLALDARVDFLKEQIENRKLIYSDEAFFDYMGEKLEQCQSALDKIRNM